MILNYASTRKHIKLQKRLDRKESLGEESTPDLIEELEEIIKMNEGLCDLFFFCYILVRFNITIQCYFGYFLINNSGVYYVMNKYV